MFAGYVFMFITLTLIPTLLIMGLMRGKTKLLCWRQCRCGVGVVWVSGVGGCMGGVCVYGVVYG